MKDMRVYALLCLCFLALLGFAKGALADTQIKMSTVCMKYVVPTGKETLEVVDAVAPLKMPRGFKSYIIRTGGRGAYCLEELRTRLLNPGLRPDMSNVPARAILTAKRGQKGRPMCFDYDDDTAKNGPCPAPAAASAATSVTVQDAPVALTSKTRSDVKARIQEFFASATNLCEKGNHFGPCQRYTPMFLRDPDPQTPSPPTDVGNEKGIASPTATGPSLTATLDKQELDWTVFQTVERASLEHHAEKPSLTMALDDQERYITKAANVADSGSKSGTITSWFYTIALILTIIVWLFQAFIFGRQGLRGAFTST